MTNTIQVREYQTLKLDNKVSKTENANKISQNDFDFLANLENTANPFLKQYYQEPETKDPPKIVQFLGKKSLQIQNYVGIIRLLSGTILEILPKVQITKNEMDEKQKLIDMIVSTLTPRISENSRFKDDKDSLMEYIIWWFLRLMDNVFKRGIKQDYVEVQENSTFVKGKILFAQNILHNSALQHRTFIEYEDYTPDCIENRVLHSALLACVKHSTAPENKSKAVRYCHMFDSISEMDSMQDFNKWKDNRYYPHYQDIKPIAEIILRGIQPFMNHGKQDISAVLFPMEVVYEKYIAQCLDRYATDYTVHSQHKRKQLTHKGFYLQPDIVMTHKQNETTTILDTKWKRYKLDHKRRDVQGVNPSDAYQMFAYSQAYNADVILLYPKSYNSNQADEITHRFKHGNEKKLCTYLTDLSNTPKLTDLSNTPKKIAEQIVVTIKSLHEVKSI